jgi:sterol desaturase/sphingolipid hydroxylase (fatty acid hydroxylase superfamily)
MKYLPDYFNQLWPYGMWLAFDILCACLDNSWHYWWIFLVVIALSPFIEYFAHVYILHAPYKVNSPIRNDFLDDIHREHHKRPRDMSHLWGDMRLVCTSIITITILTAIIFRDSDIIIMVQMSCIIYYLIYEWFHLVAHTDLKPLTRYGKYMKNFHLWHHYKNDSYWYGITSPIGDILFGKFKNPHKTEKSIPMFMDWKTKGDRNGD